MAAGRFSLFRGKIMKCERRGHNNKGKKVWIPRGSVLIPPHRVMKSKKAYDRKKEKREERFTEES